MVLKTPKGRNLLFFCAAHFCDSRATIFRFYCGMFSLRDSNACSSGQVTLGRRDNVHSWVYGRKFLSPPVTKPPQLSCPMTPLPPTQLSCKQTLSQQQRAQPVPCRKHILENNENTQTSGACLEISCIEWNGCNIAAAANYAPWCSRPSIKAEIWHTHTPSKWSFKYETPRWCHHHDHPPHQNLILKSSFSWWQDG